MSISFLFQDCRDECFKITLNKLLFGGFLRGTTECQCSKKEQDDDTM